MLCGHWLPILPPRCSNNVRLVGRLTHPIWPNKYLRQDAKVRIWKSVLRTHMSQRQEIRYKTRKVLRKYAERP